MKKLHLLFAAIAAVAACVPVPLRAATFTWDGGSTLGSQWSRSGNWVSDNAPSPADATTDLIFSGYTRLNAEADQAWSMRSITFGSTFGSNVGAFTLQGSALTIGAGGVTNMGDNITHSIQNNIALSAQQKWTSSWGNLTVSGSIDTNGNTLIVGGGTDSSRVTLSGAIIGSGGLMKTDFGGLLVLSGSVANTFTGNTIVDNGTMELAKSNGVNAIAGPLYTRGIVRLAASNQIADTSTVGISDGGRLVMNGFTEAIGALTLSGGTVTGGGTLTLGGDVNANSVLGPNTVSINLNLGGATRTFTVNDYSGLAGLTLDGPLTDGGIIKTGTGTMRLLSASPAYNGPTHVTDGTLVVNGSISGSAVTVGNGATLSGFGSVGPVSISGGNLVPGNAGGSLLLGDAVGTLTTGSLTLTSGTSLRFELSAPGVVGSSVNDLLSVNGNLTLDGTLIVTERAGFGSGTYRLFNYTGTLIDNRLDLQPAFLAAHPGSTISTATAGQVNLIVVPEPSSAALIALGTALLQRARRKSSLE